MRDEVRHLLVNDESGVRTVTLNRPDSLNAINYDVLEELERVAFDSHHDPAVRAVVIKGSGRAFCAGDDLKGMGTERTPLPDDANRRAELGYPRLILALRHLPKPVIAQVHGPAMGAGCDLVLASDLVIAADDARFALPFVLRGMHGGTTLLPRLIGYQRACELLFSGRTFDAAEAHRLGIVNTVVPADRLDETVAARAGELAVGPTAALGLMKRAINQSLGLPLEGAVEIQRHALAALYHTHDYEEGRTAFVEKRPPNYRGR